MEFGWTPGPAVVFPFASLLKILLFSSLYLFYLNCDRCAAQPWAQAAAGAGAELGPGEARGAPRGHCCVPLRGRMSPSMAERPSALPTQTQGDFFAVLMLLKIKDVSIARACG